MTIHTDIDDSGKSFVHVGNLNSNLLSKKILVTISILRLNMDGIVK